MAKQDAVKKTSMRHDKETVRTSGLATTHSAAATAGCDTNRNK